MSALRHRFRFSLGLHAMGYNRRDRIVFAAACGCGWQGRYRCRPWVCRQIDWRLHLVDDVVAFW